MSDVDIQSPQNPLVKTFRLAASHSKRSPRELVLAEGVRILEVALASRHRIRAAILETSFGEAGRERSVVAKLRESGVPIHRASGRLIRSIADVVQPQGILALVEVPHIGLEKAVLPPDGIVVCACGISDPGNLGTLIRTAAAAGVAIFCTTKTTVSARSPKTVRATAGAFFNSNIVEGVAPSDFLRFCRQRKLSVYRTDAKQGREYDCVDLRKPLAVLLGNEAHGLGGRDWPDVPALRIPISDEVESLNVGTAGAVILFEALRQRRFRERKVKDPEVR